MIVKQLYSQYKSYDIILFGKPLNQKTIPFSFLPIGKELEEYEVIEMDVKGKEHEDIGVSFKDLKSIKRYKYKGYVYAYVRKKEE